MLAGDLQQVVAALTLLPERGPLTRAAPRQQQRACRILAESGGEERRPVQLRRDQLAHFLGIEQQVIDVGRAVRLGQPQREAVVRVDHLDLEVEPLLHPRAGGQRPGRVHPGAEWRQYRQPPVPQLIAETLDHDRSVSRNRPGRLDLV